MAHEVGSPPSLVLQHVLRQCNILSMKDNILCVACRLGKSHKLPFKSSNTNYTPLLEFLEVNCGDLHRYPLMVTNILWALSTTTKGSHVFIFLLIRAMLNVCFNSFIALLKRSSVTSLQMSKPMAGENSNLSVLTFPVNVSFIVSRVHILLSKMSLLSVSKHILSKLV